MMKKRHDTKNSASIIEYIRGDHYHIIHQGYSEPYDRGDTYTISGSCNYHLKHCIVDSVEAFYIVIWILLFLLRICK